MDKTYKAANDAVMDFAINSTKQVVELNTKLWNDYMEMHRTLVSMVPGLDVWVPAYAKR